MYPTISSPTKPYRSTRKFASLFCIAALAPLGVSHASVILINDTFEDGDFIDNPGTPLDAAFTSNVSGGSTFGITSLSGDNVLGLSTTQNNRNIQADLPETVTLTNPGEFIQLTVTLEFTEAPNDVLGGIRIGFLDASDDETGVSFNPGAASGGAANAGRFFSAESNNLTGNVNNDPFGLDPRTVTFTLTLQDASTVAYSVSGFTTDSDTDAITDFGPLSFDGLFVESSGGGNNADFTIDDVIVSTNVAAIIPEPASLGLLGAGLMAIVGLRRRAD
ncbi:MAG: PEP-CTERM sorting domain-containing protein [Planctomycetota bacterium]